MTAGRLTLALTLEPDDGAGISWLHRNTEVLSKSSQTDGRTAMTVRVDRGKADAVRRKFGRQVASA